LFAWSPHYPPAMFVSFEGLDGSGKSTQAEVLVDWLEKQERQVVATREPGGTPLGERVRELLLDGEAMTPWAEAALFAAARAELVDRVIGPALAGGAEVVSDRFLDSSLVYQGVARGLGVERVLSLNLDAIRGILPDVTFLLLVDVEEAVKRSAGARDRIEQEGEAFMSLVDNGYRQVAGLFPQRVVAIQADRPVHDIAEEVREHVQQRAGAG
jgi:dTMP kinase